MQDVHPFVPALAAHFDETLRWTLEPSRHHPAVLMPHAAEALPVSRVAPHGPVLHDFADAKLVEKRGVHWRSLPPPWSFRANAKLLTVGGCGHSRTLDPHSLRSRVPSHCSGRYFPGSFTS